MSPELRNPNWRQREIRHRSFLSNSLLVTTGPRATRFHNRTPDCPGVLLSLVPALWSTPLPSILFWPAAAGARESTRAVETSKQFFISGSYSLHLAIDSVVGL